MSEIIPVNTKAIFFDHDDTLVGTYIAKSAQHKYVAKKWYNIELTDEKIRKHWGMPLNELYKIFVTIQQKIFHISLDSVFESF